MVPSLTAVDADGRAVRARAALRRRARPRRSPGRDRRGGRARAVPALAGARASRRRAATGWRRRSRTTRLRATPVISSIVAATAVPAVRLEAVGRGQARGDAARASSRCRGSARRAKPLGEVRGRPGCVLEGGTIDAFAEQLVAGCDEVGDVLVICGTTLIVWARGARAGRRAATTTRCRTPRRASSSSAARATPAACSSTGSTACARACRRGDGTPASVGDPGRVPVWVPYPRGERVPFQDSDAARPARRPRPHARRGGGPAGRVRGRGVRDAPHDRRVPGAGARASSRPAAAPASRLGRGARRLHRAARARVRGARRRRARRRVPRPARGRARDSMTDAARWARTVARRRARRRRGSRTRRRAVRAVLRGRGLGRQPDRDGSSVALDIRIDRDACMGSGNCSFWAPGVFDLDDDGIAIVVDPARAARRQDRARRAGLPDPGDRRRTRRRKARLTRIPANSCQAIGAWRRFPDNLRVCRSELTWASGACDYRRMPIGITEEHEELRQAVRRFVDDASRPASSREAVEATAQDAARVLGRAARTGLARPARRRGARRQRLRARRAGRRGRGARARRARPARTCPPRSPPRCSQADGGPGRGRTRCRALASG